MVKQSIVETKKWALVFRKGNRLDLAKAALARIKIMEEEVGEAEAAL
jgi:hypothetical protein